MPTPLVRIRLGSDWEKHSAGDVVRKDARRGAWIIENIPGSEPADKGSAASLGMAWPLVDRKEAPAPLSHRALIDIDSGDAFGADSPEEAIAGAKAVREARERGDPDPETGIAHAVARLDDDLDEDEEIE